MANELAAATIARVNGSGSVSVPMGTYGTRRVSHAPINMGLRFRGNYPTASVDAYRAPTRAFLSETHAERVPGTQNPMAEMYARQIGLTPGADFVTDSNGILLTPQGQTRIPGILSGLTERIGKIRYHADEIAQYAAQDVDIARREWAFSVREKALMAADDGERAYESLNTALAAEHGLGALPFVPVAVAILAMMAATYMWSDEITGAVHTVKTIIDWIMWGIGLGVKIGVGASACYLVYRTYKFVSDRSEKAREKLEGEKKAAKRASSVSSFLSSFGAKKVQLTPEEEEVRDYTLGCLQTAMKKMTNPRTQKAYSTVEEYVLTRRRAGSPGPRFWNAYNQCAGNAKKGMGVKIPGVTPNNPEGSKAFMKVWEQITNRDKINIDAWKNFPT